MKKTQTPKAAASIDIAMDDAGVANVAAAAAAATFSPNRSADILKLDIDCFKEVFDYFRSSPI